MDARVASKVRQLWPGQETAVLALLESYRGAERVRVVLGALRLSGGSLEKLRSCISAAQVDYRDILAWAESPRIMKLGALRSNATDAERQAYKAAAQQDRHEYEAWLSED